MTEFTEKMLHNRYCDAFIRVDQNPGLDGCFLEA